MKKLITYSIAFCLLLVFVSCNRGETTTSEQPTIALVLKTLNNPFFLDPLSKPIKRTSPSSLWIRARTRRCQLLQRLSRFGERQRRRCGCHCHADQQSQRRFPCCCRNGKTHLLRKAVAHGEVESVYSTGGVLAYPEIEPLGDVDNAIASLKFESGALGVVDCSHSAIFGDDIRTEILGTKGTLQVGYLRKTPLYVLTKDGVTHDTVPYFMERFGQAYVDQLQNFVDRVLSDQPPAITCGDGIAALRISLAATPSLHEQRPISL